MTLPAPQVGLVIEYAYLWAREQARGVEEGVKSRPCAIVAATRTVGDKLVVTVFPITHAVPADPQSAVEVPAPLKRHLGLDDERSWVVVTEFNRFVWPGVDLRQRPSVRPARFDYGMVPPKFMARVIHAFEAARRTHRIVPVLRTE